MFKIKTGNYLELLTAEKKKLLGSNKSKKTKNENGENVPHLGITEVVLVHCNIQTCHHGACFIPEKGKLNELLSEDIKKTSKKLKHILG